jgi:DNA modification methylase
MKLSEIHTNPSNPRLIKDDRFKKLVKSISEFPKMMELRPIVIDSNMQILGGNMRFKALKELKYKDVPELWIKRADSLTDEEKQRFIIEDNVPFGEWDFDILANEWDKEKLIEWGLELPTDFGVKLDAVEDDYEIPDEIETDIVLGDLFEIGQHRLLCGDSTDSDQVAKLMGGAFADMIFTDPPYNVDYGANKYHPSWHIRSIENDKQSPKEWEDFCKALFSNFKLFNKGDIYMWGASSPEGMRMRLWLIDSGAHWSATIIWKKQQLVLSPAKYQRMYEPCFYGWFGKSTFKADRKEVEVWEIDRPLKSKEHPTMKPIALCAKGINNSSKERDIVLDLFGGSGSTMVACEQLKRNCYMQEYDPKYCQVIIDRMRKLDPEIVIKKNGEIWESK